MTNARHGKCLYCEKEIEEGCIRCTVCDNAWQAGRDFGVSEHRDKLRTVTRHLLELSGFKAEVAELLRRD